MAAAAFAVSAPASADELVLKFATLDVPQAHLNVRIHHPWVEKINKEANGLFRIDVFDGEALANQGNIYNQVTSNVVQIGWGLPSLAGKFPLLQVAALALSLDGGIPRLPRPRCGGSTSPGCSIRNSTRSCR